MEILLSFSGVFNGKCVWELSSYHYISKKIVWKYYYATILIWSPTNSGVKISLLLKGFRICNNICTPFLGFGSYRHVRLQKAQNLEVFYSSPYLNLIFETSKVLFLNCWSFWDMIWKDVSFLSLDNQFILHLWASFHAKFGHKDKSFIRVTKCEKMDFSLPSIFLTIKN